MALWRSTFIVSAMTMLSRVLGLVRDVVLLNVFGAGKDFDTFVVAFRIPNFFRRLFAEGAFSQAFIPVLTEYKTGRAHAEVQILISRVFGCLLTVMTLLTFVAMVLAPAIIYMYAPGFHSDPEKLEVATSIAILSDDLIDLDVTIKDSLKCILDRSQGDMRKSVRNVERHCLDAV